MLRNRKPTVALFLVALAAGCSSTVDSVSLGHGRQSGGGGASEEEIDGGPSASSSGGTSASSSGGSSAAGGAGTGGSGFLSGGGRGPDGGAGVCASFVSKAEVLATDLYVMFDQSSSMNDAPPGTTTSLWDLARAGLGAFFDLPVATGAGVGIQYFPLNGIAPDSCNAPYATPDVEVSLLPGSAGPLHASLAAHAPVDLTPMGPALAGAIAHMKAWAPSHPGRLASVVLVTDGFATECEPLLPADIAQLAKDAFETEPRVKTYVVGLRVANYKQNLNGIAQAGGTDAAVFIDDGDVAGQLTQALIHTTRPPVACTISLPEPPPDGSYDSTLVSMWFTSIATGVAVQQPILAGVNDCGDSGGWYYDPPNTSTKIVSCPATCSLIQSGEVEVRYDCFSH